MRLIHLSDLHIGSSDNLDATRSIVDALIDKKGDHGAEVVIITGDIVDDGEAQQVADARTQFKRLIAAGFTVIPVPGNHDYGNNGVFESWTSKDRFHSILQLKDEYPRVIDGTVGSEHYRVICLDSMEEEMERVEFWGAQGKLGKKQLEKLDKLLSSTPAKTPVIVALHHHPFYYNRWLTLRDAGALKEVIRGRIQCLLFGHKHSQQGFRTETNQEAKYDIPLIWASHKSTDLRRTPHGAGYEIGIVHTGAWTVTPWYC